MKIAIKNLQKKIHLSPVRIRKAILKALSLEEAKLSGEITVCFVNDKLIKRLNQRFRKCRRPTDVIAFDLSQGPRCLLADIVISTDAACRNARIFKTAPDYELCLYAIHGLLHLLGYDDATPERRRRMQKKAERIISLLK